MICTNCQSQYGQTVNVRDGGKAEWKCRDCGKVQPWVDEPVGGLRPAKLADLAKRPAWIEAAARDLDGIEYARDEIAEIIEIRWREGIGK